MDRVEMGITVEYRYRSGNGNGNERTGMGENENEKLIPVHLCCASVRLFGDVSKS
jgi:hypothetical protein